MSSSNPIGLWDFEAASAITIEVTKTIDTDITEFPKTTRASNFLQFFAVALTANSN